MSTALELVNAALLNVGENEVVNFTNPVGKKAFNMLKSSILTVTELMDWPFLRETNTATWVTNVANIPAFKYLQLVTYDGVALDEVVYSEMVLLLASNTTLSTPCKWTVSSDTEVLVWPAPTALQQPLVKFTGFFKPVLPANTTSQVNDIFSIDFEQLVQLYLEYLLHKNHTADATAAVAARNEFDTRLHYQRQTKTVGNIYVIQ